MTPFLLTELEPFRLACDEQRLRDSADYQKIRTEINRRFNPLSGITEWERVRLLCEQLAASEGVDLLVAIYYTVAAVKTLGLAGLANGLELQAAVLQNLNPNNGMPANRRVELYAWMLVRVGAEIRGLKPKAEQLRDLYRCERACQVIDTRLNRFQPDNMPDIEAVGFSVFEHIDQIEQSGKKEPVASVTTPRSRFPFFMMAFCLGCAVAVSLVRLLPNSSYLSSDKTPQSQLIREEQVPQVISLDQGRVLQSSLGADLIEAQRPYLSKIYSAKVTALVEQKAGVNLLNGVDLANSLQRLYPNDPAANELRNKTELWQQSMTEELTALSQRFKTARTRAANISQQVQRGNLTNLHIFSKGLENYAISLSPLVGRITYAQELINSGELQRARDELITLELGLKALALQKAKLDLKLEKMEEVNSKRPAAG